MADVKEVSFRSHHNTYLAIVEGHLVAEPHISTHSKFTIAKHHHLYTLQSHNGTLQMILTSVGSNRGNLHAFTC